MVLRPATLSWNCKTLISMLSPIAEEDKPCYTQKMYKYYLQNSSRPRKYAVVINFSLPVRRKVGPGQIQMHAKKLAAVTITDLSSFLPWAKADTSWLSWISLRPRCQSKIFTKAYCFSYRAYQNAPSFLLMISGIYRQHRSIKAKRYSQQKVVFSVAACLVPSQSNGDDRKNRTIWPSLLVTPLKCWLTPPTPSGNFPITGKFPTRENSLLLPVVHSNKTLLGKLVRKMP